MKRLLSFLLALSLFAFPVSAKSNDEESLEERFWNLANAMKKINSPNSIVETESYSDYYLSGYQDGYNAGYQAGFAMGLESASKQPTKDSVSGLSPSVSQNKSDLKPVSTPANGKILKRPKDEMLAPLTIHTTGDKYYFFSLMKVGYSDSYMSFFGHGGKTIEVDVPIGVYKIYYATGETWYGTNDLFGPETSYYRCGDYFIFTKDDESYKGWVLTLYPVVDGNMDSESVSADDFPK